MKPLHASACRALLLALAWLAIATSRAVAQDPPDTPSELPAEVGNAVIAFYNDSAQVRLRGESRIAAGTTVGGTVAVLEGTLTLGGTVNGSVMVLNGNAVLLPGAVIDGSLTVVGGAIRGLTDAVTVGGRIAEYAAPLRYTETGGVLAFRPPREAEPALMAGRQFEYGRLDLRVTTRGAYNRVEGLPVSIGGRIALGDSNPTWLDGALIYRTATGIRLDPDDTGWIVRVEQYLGGRLAARLGATLRSEIVAIESQHLSDLEASLATFLLHRDQRDHYLREGFGIYLRVAKPNAPREVTLEYREEEHHSVASRGPWTIFDNDEPWRPEPVIAAGRLRSLSLRWGYDDRNDRRDPDTGYLARVELEQGLGGTLEEEVLVTPTGLLRSAQPADRRFTTLIADLRRYARLGPTSRLAVRLLAAGSIDGGKPLPPQRQHALGGAGSLPAYSLFAFDCGARSDTVGINQRGWYPYYGCDRSMLLQLEYRGSLGYGADLGRALKLGVDLGTPGWAVFFDAGRAWTEAEAIENRSGGLDDFVVDAGAGVKLGPVGLYWALPLSRRVEEANFFVRIGPRF